MTIRQKTIAAFSFAFLLLMAGGYGVTRVILLDGFRALERTAAQRDLARLRAAVQDRLVAISIKGSDWSNWDETYRFMADRSPSFPARYLNDFNLEQLRLNAMILADTGGRPAAWHFVDLRTRAEAPLRDALLARIAAAPAFFLAGASGVMALPGGAMLVVSHPVRDSKATKEPRGIFVFARDLDAAEIAELSASTGLALSLATAGDPPLTGAGDTAISPRDGETLDSALALADLQGGRGVVLRAAIPREIYRHGLVVQGYILLGLGVVGVVISLVALLLSQRLVLSRIYRLAGEVDGIARGRDITRRIRLPGSDEISGLARQVNVMLEELDASERALRRSEEALSVTLGSIVDGVITADLEGKVLLLNRTAEALTGWTRAGAEGSPLSEVFPLVHLRSGAPVELGQENALRQGKSTTLPSDALLVRKDGSRVEVSGSIAPMKTVAGGVMGAALIFRDMTAHRSFEEEILKARKLESVAVLAAGIAHDFDTVLGGVIGNISLARSGLKAGDKAERFLEQGEKAAQRARALAGQLRAFSRGGTLVKRRAAVEPLVKEAVGDATRGSMGVAVYSLPGGLWPVEVDEGQMGQVFRNLALNSVQAMPKGGVITVAGENAVLDAFNSQALPPGRYVKLTFEDEGAGIPEALLPRVFDPFFTTRERQSGLGLAIAYSVLLRHQGRIAVRSVPGSGATFTLFVPASSEIPS